MNIAFDATAILGVDSRNRGIGNYSMGQFTTMIDQDEENKYFFINFIDTFRLSDSILNKDRLQEDYFYMGKDNFLLNSKEYEEIVGDIITSYIRKNKIDIFYITSPFDWIVRYKKEWFEDVTVVATVYDIIPYIFPKRYLTDINFKVWYMEQIEGLRWTDKLLTISQSVKDDLIHYLGFDKEKIEVIYGAVNRDFNEIVITNEEKRSLYNKYSIEDKFVLCTGGDDIRKNIGGLITAYSQLPMKLINEFQLVVVCKLSETGVEHYTNIISKNHVKGRVILTNFVPSEELVQFYNLATLMAFPSKYEGFGLPIVEAWACGTPVLTSNNSSLGEIAEGAGILVNPFDINSIRNGLTEALSGDSLDRLTILGKEKLKKYQWEVVSQKTIDILMKLKKKKNLLDSARKKIAFFTPLPPIQSGIADYSFDIIAELIKYFDIDVYIDNTYKAQCELPENVNVFSHEKYENNKNLYYDTIYQMGNSEYHVYMHKYIQNYSGTLVLHDYNLHNLIRSLTVYDLDRYKKYLCEDYSHKEVKVLLRSLSEGPVSNMEINGYVTNYSNKIIVHSDEARKKLLRKDIGKYVKTVRHYAKIEELADTAQVKEKFNISKDTIIFGAFGHIHENKRVIPILRAFGKLCEIIKDTKFIFVGKMYSGVEKEFSKLVKELHIEDKVHVTGYIEIDEFVNYFDLMDICANLRYPYNGETSGALMRILSRGKPVIVNNIGSFKEIPDEACIKIPNVAGLSKNEEVEYIYKAFRELAENSEKLEKISKNARLYAENNLDLEIIGKQYRDVILDGRVSHLNEMIIEKIKKNHIANPYSKEELIELSNTLGYIYI